MRSRIRDVKVVEEDCGPTHKKPLRRSVLRKRLADRMVGMYKENIKPLLIPNDPKKEQVELMSTVSVTTSVSPSNSWQVSGTVAVGLLLNSHLGANGDVNPGETLSYNALVVAKYRDDSGGLQERDRDKNGACWKGYTWLGTVEGYQGFLCEGRGTD